MEREQMAYDVVIVGAGPSGLACAIRLKQLAGEDHVRLRHREGSEVGAHILSGAVLEPRSLNELLPDWKNLGAPVETEVTEDQFLYLTEKTSRRLPTPPPMHNKGNYIISLGLLCRWLAEQAEGLGVETIRALPRPRCSMTMQVPCAELPPATWASAATASQPMPTSQAWSCLAGSPCSPKAAAGP